MMLQVEDLQVYYGAIHALKGISFNLEQGEIVALIGGNGAGKSTTLNTISGLLHPKSGRVVFKGDDISMVPPQDIVRLQIIQVPEGRRIFPKLTVQENLEMGAYIFQDKAQIAKDMEYVMDLFPRLRERRKQFGGTLSGGEQQRVAIARAVAKNADLLLCDEPTGALDFETGIKILKLLKDINDKYKKTVVIITHNVPIGEMADRVIRMRSGEITEIKVNENPIDPERIVW